LKRLKIKAELFLPPKAKSAAGRGAAPPEDNPAMQEIWHVVGAIPRGQVSTYGSVARAGGRIVFPPSSLAHREQTRRLLAEKVVVKNGRVSRDFLITLEER
jgi:alkylated DNA nucleotide flippase Atl1